jgi:ABC-2 type transport system permease protein
VKSKERAKLRSSVAKFPLIVVIYKTYVIAELEVRKMLHEPSEILTRSLQPIIWLLLFGQVMARSHLIDLTGVTYLDYLTPGVLGQSILFVAIFYGIAIIWERDLGIVHKLLVSPTPRVALVTGKALAAGIRAFSQVIVIYLLAILLGVHLSHSFWSLAGVMLFTFLGAATFATFSLIVACMVKTRERFMGIGQVITMPLFFASNAIYPVAIMPNWLKTIASLNPLSYEVDAFRTFMLEMPSSIHGVMFDFIVLGSTLAFLLAIAAWMYPKIVQ